MIKTITSVSHAAIKQVLQLHESSYRKEQQQFIAQGFTTYTTLIDQGYKPLATYATSNFCTMHPTLAQTQQVTIVSDHVMKKISTTSTPTGLVAIFGIPMPKLVKTSQALVLHNIQDPGNLGTLIRTAAAMNIHMIFTIDGCDPFHPKVVQATAGTLGFVGIVPTTWQKFIQEYGALPTCALVVAGGKQPEELHLDQAILIIGNEGQGLPDAIVRDCKLKMTLPMPGKTESLNVAVAGSIALYLKSIAHKKL